MKAFIKLVPLVLLGALLTSAAQTAEASSTGSLPGFCDLDPTANVWQGLGVGPGTTDQWEDGSNWSTGKAPGSLLLQPTADQDVCVPTGGLPRIRTGEEEQLRTLDVASGATVRVDQGGKLFVYGSQTGNQDSVVRKGGKIDVTAGTLGGIAKLHVLGAVLLRNNGFASTLLTRDCSYDDTPGPTYPGEEPCPTTPTPVSGPTFFMEVDDTGVLDVRGGGVNLGDQTKIVDRGLVAVRAGAYVAADHGTRLELRAHRTSAAGAGTLRFYGDGGWLEGKIESDTGIARLGTLVNQGLVTKTGGSGRTLVSAAYSQPSPGAVRVNTGTLLLPTGPVRPAFVAGGSTYGTGRCAQPDDPTCTPTTMDRSGFRQNADLRVPAADTSGARVVVRQLARKSTSADLGYPFEVHATSLAATARKPAIIRLRIDASVAKGKGWGRTKVYRKSGSAPYRLVRACTSTGRPPAGEVACVDRRGLSVSSRNIANASGKPDVLMVIRTTRTSRWVGR